MHTWVVNQASKRVVCYLRPLSSHSSSPSFLVLNKMIWNDAIVAIQTSFSSHPIAYAGLVFFYVSMYVVFLKEKTQHAIMYHPYYYPYHRIRVET